MYSAPGGGEYSAPGGGEYSAPGDGEYSAPGDGEYSAPGGGEYSAQGRWGQKPLRQGGVSRRGEGSSQPKWVGQRKNGWSRQIRIKLNEKRECIHYGGSRRLAAGRPLAAGSIRP